MTYRSCLHEHLGAEAFAGLHHRTTRAMRNDVLPLLELIQIDLAELRQPVRNVRQIDPTHTREVADSIAALGFCAPVLIGKDNKVLDGEIRVEAAKLLGLPTNSLHSR